LLRGWRANPNQTEILAVEDSLQLAAGASMGRPPPPEARLAVVMAACLPNPVSQTSQTGTLVKIFVIFDRRIPIGSVS
jgi:hypothetical protein